MGHLGIFIDIFDKEKYEKKMSDYDYAKNNSFKLLCLSSQLLKEAAQYKVKAWNTLPRPSHGRVSPSRVYINLLMLLITGSFYATQWE